MPNVVIVSDLHVGCQLGLCPPGGAVLDGGGQYRPSRLQRVVWSWWREFWETWVPTVTKRQPFAVVLNGDALDGRHHNATTQFSQNLADQANLAYEILKPVADRAKLGYYHIRGTEAHAGPAGEEEERLAQRLGAIPSETSHHARWELWVRVGDGLVHILHQIGSTGSQAYEATAVHKELVESYVEAARWGERAPDVIVRSHRHRHISTQVATARGHGIAFTTAGWQLKTPFVYRIAGARLAQPQIGGSIVRAGDEDVFARHWVRRLERPRIE